MIREDHHSSDQDTAITGGRTLAIALAVPTLIGLFLLITSTVYLFPKVAVLDSKRVLQMAVMLTITLIALIEPGIRSAFTRQLARIPAWIAVGIFLFFLIGMTSSLVNAGSLFSLAYSLLDVYLLVQVVVMALIVAACRSIAAETFDRLVISLIVLLGLAVGMQEFVGVYVAWSAGYQFSYDIALTHFAHPRFYNQLQSWTVPIVVALPILFPSKRLAALLCALVLGLHWYILLMSGARGSILSLIAVMIAALVLVPVIRGTIIKWQLAGILIGIGIYGFMFLGPEAGWESPHATTVLSDTVRLAQPDEAGAILDNNRGRVESEGSNSYFDLSLGRPMMHSSGRIDLWKAAIRLASEQPILGIGPMNYACQGPPGRVGHPHNFALRIVSEWGIPALLVLLAIVLGLFGRLLSWFRGSRRSQENSLQKTQILLAMGILSAGLHAGLSGILMTPASQMAAALICGWFLGTFSPVDHPLPGGTRRNFASGTLVLLLSAGVIFSYFAKHELENMPGYREQLPAFEKLAPRFWQLGKACRQDLVLTSSNP